jgi:hypothetical protein
MKLGDGRHREQTLPFVVVASFIHRNPPRVCSLLRTEQSAPDVAPYPIPLTTKLPVEESATATPRLHVIACSYKLSRAPH